MSNTAIIAYIIIFVSIEFGFLTLFGSTQPGFQSAINAPYQCLVNNYPASNCAWVQWNPPTPTNVTAVLNSTPWYKCIFSTPCVFAAVTGSVGGQSSAQAIWNGFSIFGYGISAFIQDVYVFFTKVGNSGLLLSAFITFLNTANSGVPFLGNIMLGFTVLVIIFIAAVIKPGGHGS